MNYPTQLEVSNLYVNSELILENYVFDFEKNPRRVDADFVQGILDYLNTNFHIEQQRSSADTALARKHGIPVHRVNSGWKVHDENQIGMRGWIEFLRKDGTLAVLFTRGPHDDLTNFVGEYPKLKS